MQVQFDEITQRWSIGLPDEPGRPVIIADTAEALEQFLNFIEIGIHAKQPLQVKQGAA